MEVEGIFDARSRTQYTGRMRVLLLDNLDSFTHNVRHGLVEAGADVVVLRRDQGTVLDIEREAPDLLVISPGPGRPEDARLAMETIQTFAESIPILGVCLGHQCLALSFGGRVERAPQPVHGKVSSVRHGGCGLFDGMPDPFEVGRYHSLAVTHLPDCLERTAWTEDGVIMGLRHRSLPIAGIQFHPDSFLTPLGTEIFRHAITGRF